MKTQLHLYKSKIAIENELYHENNTKQHIVIASTSH